MFPDHLDFFSSIGSIFVEAYDHGLAETLEIPYMSVKVSETLSHAFRIRLLYILKGCTSMHLEAVERGDKDCKIRLESALPALDVEELLCA